MIERKDWEDAKRQADLMIKQAEIMIIVNKNLADIAEKAIKKFPEEKKTPIGV